MSIRVIIPASLSAWLAGRDEAQCQGDTLSECLDHLAQQFPGLKEKIIGDDPGTPRVLIFVNGENIRSLDGLNTRVRDGDEVGIIPLAAGG
jgi:molybdopterin synthase sulfur carrier subunit